MKRAPQSTVRPRARAYHHARGRAQDRGDPGLAGPPRRSDPELGGVLRLLNASARSGRTPERASGHRGVRGPAGRGSRPPGGVMGRAGAHQDRPQGGTPPRAARRQHRAPAPLPRGLDARPPCRETRIEEGG